MVGSPMHVTRFAGPPAEMTASFSIAIVRIETLLAAGCALKTTALPAASIPIALQMMVEVGLVLGVMAAITPNGAGSVNVKPRSPLHARGSSASTPGVLFATSRFLTSLSSQRPRPVSEAAIRASCSASASIDSRIRAMISRRISSESALSSSNARPAAATADSMSANTPARSVAALGLPAPRRRTICRAI